MKPWSSFSQISKSQRKKIKRRMKLADQDESSTDTTNPDLAPDHTPSTDSDNPTPTMDDRTPVADDPSEEVRSKLDYPKRTADMEDTREEHSNEESRSRVIARSKFKNCDNCGEEIVSRILVCAGCKKVAYCNFRCQKASWKVHKKTCSYALRKDGKESTG